MSEDENKPQDEEQIDAAEETDTQAEETAQEESVQEEGAQESSGETSTPAGGNPRPFYMEEAITFADIQQHLLGPIIAVLGHAVLILVLVFAIKADPLPKEVKELEIESKDVDIEELKVEDLPEPEPPPETETVTETDFTDMPVEQKFEVKHDQAQMSAEIAPPTVAVSDASFASDDIMTDATMPVVETTKSKLKLRGAFANRGPAGRLTALKAYGGGANTERAVERALKWMVKVQNEDGSWGDVDDQYNQKVQLTCLALLAFLAHGETPQSEVYGDALMKGLQKVMEWANTNRHEANYNEEGKPVWKVNDSYNTARIAIVLAEGFAITKIPALERGMNKAVDWIIQRQNEQGGFGQWTDQKTGTIIYGFSLDEGSRLYNALYCAYHAGCEHPGMKQSIERSINAMDKFLALKKGGFLSSRNAAADAKPVEGQAGFEATGAGTLYLYLMGSNGKAAKRGYKWLCEFQPNKVEKSELKMDWHNLPSQTSALGWYYMTQALFQGSSGKGKEWTKWNKSIMSTLSREQAKGETGGYWLCPADKYEHFDIKRVNKSKNPKKPKMVEEKVLKIYNESSNGGFTDLNGKLWATVYFTLSLEVYYRYLPTFQPDGKRTRMDLDDAEAEAEAAAQEKKADDDDISLE